MTYTKIAHIAVEKDEVAGYNSEVLLVRITKDFLPFFQKMLIKGAPDDTFIQFDMPKDF